MTNKSPQRPEISPVTDELSLVAHAAAWNTAVYDNPSRAQEVLQAMLAGTVSHFETEEATAFQELTTHLLVSSENGKLIDFPEAADAYFINDPRHRERLTAVRNAKDQNRETARRTMSLSLLLGQAACAADLARSRQANEPMAG
jgi:hypothetical protein